MTATCFTVVGVLNKLLTVVTILTLTLAPTLPLTLEVGSSTCCCPRTYP